MEQVSIGPLFLEFLLICSGKGVLNFEEIVRRKEGNSGQFASNDHTTNYNAFWILEIFFWIEDITPNSKAKTSYSALHSVVGGKSLRVKIQFSAKRWFIENTVKPSSPARAHEFLFYIFIGFQNQWKKLPLTVRLVAKKLLLYGNQTAYSK